MPPISLTREVRRLQFGIDRAFIDRLHPHLREAALRLPSRLHPGAPDEAWTAHFSPLILLYPQLQLEEISGLPRARLRAINVPHALLVFHAFLEDRELDRQVELSRHELLLLRWMFVTALDLMRGLLVDWDASSEGLLAGYRSYLAAQEPSAGRSAPAGRATAERRRAAVFHRAGVGALTAMVVARDSGLAPDLVTEIDQATRDLILGLQWLDDLRDWRDDLGTGSANLLFDLLRNAPGSDHLEEAASEAQVERGLIRHDIPLTALNEAAGCLRSARDRQHRLGCRTLARLVAERLAAIERLATDITDGRHAAVLAAFTALLGSSSSESDRRRSTAVE